MKFEDILYAIEKSIPEFAIADLHIKDIIADMDDAQMIAQVIELPQPAAVSAILSASAPFVAAI